MNRREFLSTAAAAAAPFGSSEAPRPIRFYGRTAALEGAAELDRLRIYMRWLGAGAATWSMNSEKTEDYQVAACYASGAPGSQLAVVCGRSSVRGATVVTQGPYDDPLTNYERISFDGVIRLQAGANQVRLQLSGPQRDEAMRVRGIELTPVSSLKAIAADQARAAKARSSTDWLVRSGYGLMFHWTSQSQPRHGPQLPYKEAVDRFPLDAFVETVAETGAGHVIFTLNHAASTCPAPIRTWEQYHPGLTTERDLLGEIAEKLDRHGVRLIIYINSPRFGTRRTAGKGEGIQGVDARQYVDMHREVLTEIGRRYGRRLAGYWFDSWYQGFEQFPDVRQDLVFQACKEGNPERLTAFNFWIFPSCTEWQEYWAGEMGEPQRPAAARRIEAGAGRGLQHQSLLYLDAPWVHSKPDTEMEQPRFTAEKLIAYIRDSMSRQGVVTVNLGIYQEGDIGPQARRIMSAVRDAIRG